MAKSSRRKINKVSKSKQVIELIKEWKEVIAIIISVGTLIYYVSTYKAEIDNRLKNKVNEQEVRTLIQIENQDLKEDVKIIKKILMEGK
jgi:predicted phage-related endonuclease